MKERNTAAGGAAPPAKKEPLLTTNFVLACLITLASFASFYYLLATLPVYITTIGGDEREVGLIMGVFSATTVILRPFIGRAADDRGRRIFILVGNAILAVASALYAGVTSVALLLGLRVFHGVGWASGGTTMNALVADIAPRSRRGEAMGYFGMFSNLAMAVGPALGFMLMNAFSFPVLFFTAAAIAAIAVVLGFALREPARLAPPPATAKAGKAPGQGVIERTTLFPAAVLTLVTITYGSIVSFLPLFAAKQGIENPGIFFTVYAIVLILARGFTGQLSDRYGRAAVIVPGLVLATAALWLLATATVLPTFLAVAVLYGLAFAAVQPALMALVVDRAAPSRRGAAMGTFSAAMDLGIGLGSLLWGEVAYTAGFQVVYLASGGFAVLALLVFLVGARGQGVFARPTAPQGGRAR